MVKFCQSLDFGAYLWDRHQIYPTCSALNKGPFQEFLYFHVQILGFFFFKNQDFFSASVNVVISLDLFMECPILISHPMLLLLIKFYPERERHVLRITRDPIYIIYYPWNNHIIWLEMHIYISKKQNDYDL